MDGRWTRREFIESTALAGAGLLSVPSDGPRAATPKVGETGASEAGREGRLRAGAAAVDISPEKLPVVASGGFLERMGDEVHDPLHARALVLDDGATRVAILVVDTLMMPREMLDAVKRAAARSTGIAEDRMLISATHTHSAPSVMGALGTGVDEAYAAFLPGRLVECIERANANLEPAEAGWGAIDDSQDTNCRVWIRRPDRIGLDPFGQPTIRAMMHPGYQNPDYIGPCGPEDPALSVFSVQSPDGRPITLLANYSMHYFGASPVSADYFGRFVQKIGQLIGVKPHQRPFVGIMSHGTSGDQHWMDYSQPKKEIDIDAYAERVARAAFEVYKQIEYDDRIPIAMAETRLTLQRRLPDEERLAWAEELISAMGQRTKPNDRPEVYALEQIYLRDDPVRELKLQALRIGGLGITAIPCEVYAISGLKLKLQSPLELTMNIELANGGEGYIPPPELHPLGGYNTWPARTAGLERQAEPKIVETVLGLLEEVAQKPRRTIAPPGGPYVAAVRASKPRVFWPMRDLAGPGPIALVGGELPAVYEDGVAFYLEGPEAPGLSASGETPRAAHFAGGRMTASLDTLGESYSVALWFWNGLPADARAVAGYLFSRGEDGAKSAPGDHLGIGGTHRDGTLQGKLFFFNGDRRNQLVVGATDIPVKTWNHAVLVRSGPSVSAYLNGNRTAEFSGPAEVTFPPAGGQVFLGGRNDDLFNFEGKICSVAVYDRVLSPDEIAAQYQAALTAKS
jgi:hypothetical protein